MSKSKVSHVLPPCYSFCSDKGFTTTEIESGKVYIVAKSLADSVFPKKKKAKTKAYEVLATMKGSELAGRRYEPMFDYFLEEFSETGWRVLQDSYVSDSAGTGIVHQVRRIASGTRNSPLMRWCISRRLVLVKMITTCA